MALIKCISCYNLHREEITAGESPRLRLTVYNCSRFPYACALSGLLRPGNGIVKAITDCPQRIDAHCILCQQRPVTSYGLPPVAWACKKHDAAWGKWLEKHPERRAYLAPKGRVRKANWVEVFREFIEDIRVKQEIKHE